MKVVQNPEDVGVDMRAWAGGSHRGSQAHTSLPVFHLPGGVTGTGPAPLRRSLLWLGPYPVTGGRASASYRGWTARVSIFPSPAPPTSQTGN